MEKQTRISTKATIITVVLAVGSATFGLIEWSLSHFESLATIEYVNDKFDKFYIEILTVAINQKQNRLAQIEVLRSLNKLSPSGESEIKTLKISIKELQDKKFLIEQRSLKPK